MKLKVNRYSEQGFTMVDVLASILIATAFVLISLQATMVATIHRVKASRSYQANNWIQESIEEAKFIAQQLEVEDLDTTPINEELVACGKEGLSDASNSYGQQLKDALPGVNDAIAIDRNNLLFVAVDSTASQPNPNTDVDGKSIWLLRNANVQDIPPYQTLELSYLVVVDDNGVPSPQEQDTVAQSYTEIIPDAVFDCP